MGKKKKAVKKEKAEKPSPSFPLALPDVQEPLLADTLEQQQHNLMEQDNDIKTVSRELFSRQNIEAKTELSHNEIIHVTKLRFLKERFGVRNVEDLITSLETLRVSKDRKSRKEFVDALQTENRSNQGSGFFSGFKKLFGGEE